MIDPDHPELSIVRQCELVATSRSGFYYQPAEETPLNLELMRLIDRQFLETPWYGSRQMARHLRREGYPVGRKRVLTMFQPHRYSRTKLLRKEFGKAFDHADRVVIDVHVVL